jgi:2'-5' RNA ligase
VHVTLRGRFIAGQESAFRAFRRLTEVLEHAPRSVELHLTGPEFQSPDLVWLEVDPKTPGQRALFSLNRIAESACKQCVLVDEVPREHKGDRFRPHVTLAWGVKKNLLKRARFHAPTRLVSRITRIALARYPDEWPAGSIELVMAFSAWEGSLPKPDL